MTKKQITKLKAWLNQEAVYADKQSTNAYLDNNVQLAKYFSGQCSAYVDVLTQLTTLEKGGDPPMDLGASIR